MEPLTQLRLALRAFATDRDWDQFHTPRNLAAALAVEAGELLEQFQWMTDASSQDLTPRQRVAVGHEMADVLLYLIRLGDKLDIDLVVVANDKLALNATKYPIDKAHGSAKKYTEF